MPSSFSGRRALLVLAFLLAIPVLGAGGAWFWIQRTADRKWEAAKLRIQELSAACPDRLPPLPPSETAKGLQIHFVAVIREAAARRSSRGEDSWKLISRRDSSEAVDVFLGDVQDFLDRLHEGARLCAATPEHFPPGWRGEWDAGSIQFTMNCVVIRARRLRERGSPADAADTILDSLQLVRFWAASGQGHSRGHALSALDDSLDELRDILARETLAPTQLRRIESELGPLEAALRSPTACFEHALARWGEELEAWDLEGTGIMNGAPYRWRWLLPKHLMKAEALEFYDRHLQRLKGVEATSAVALAIELEQFHRQAIKSKNPIISDANVFRWVELKAIKRLAEYRLLRIAARYRASGELLALTDPFGGTIRHSKNGTRMKFWSVGYDGQDDGGDGGTEGRWTGRVKDLVIDVPLNE